MPKKENAVILDCLNVIYRLFFSKVPHFSHPQTHRPIGALVAFVKILLQIKKSSPGYIAVVSDSQTSTLSKKQLFSYYKASREKMPEDLLYQVKMLPEIVNSIGCNFIEKPGVEADDIIACIINEFSSSADTDVTIYTNDKDLLQLVSNNVYVKRKSNTSDKFEIFKRDEVIEKMGCPPERIVDLLSIAGDASDNIPGVSGIGSKGALVIVSQFPSLEEAIKNKHLLPNRVANKLNEEALSAFYLSKSLIALNNKICKIPKILIKSKEISNDANTIFRSLGIGYLLNSNENKETISCKVTLFDSLDLNYIKSKNVFIYYTIELDDPYPFHRFSSLVISIDGRDSFLKINSSNFHFLNEIIKLSSKVYIFNLKRFINALKVHNIDIPINSSIRFFDVSIAQFLLDSSGNDFCHKIAFRDLEKTQIEGLPLPADIFINIYKIESRINQNKLNFVLDTIDTPFSWALSEMERNGIFIDEDKLIEIKKEYSKNLSIVEKKIYELSGKEFNINSSKQLSEVLFVDLGIKRPNLNSNSTDAQALAKIDHPISDLIIKFRHYKKIISTYVDGLIKYKNRITNRIHPELNLFGTSTGRISCKNPNLQNLPTIAISKIRSAVIPTGNNKMISADYKQMEIKVLAVLSKESELIDMLERKKDVHTSTASKIFNKEEKEVTLEERSIAKTVNFGIMYGQHAKSLSESIKIKQKEAEKLIADYYASFPKIKDFKYSAIKYAKIHGVSKTLFGRIRFIKEINDKNYSVKSFGERIALNSPIQGTASDIIKLRMIELYKSLIKSPCRILLQIHDEILLETNDCNKELLSLIQNILEESSGMPVNLEVSIKCSSHW